MSWSRVNEWENQQTKIATFPDLFLPTSITRPELHVQFRRMSIITLILFLSCISSVLYSRLKRRNLSNRKSYLSSHPSLTSSSKLIAFFHPYWSVPLPLSLSLSLIFLAEKSVERSYLKSSNAGGGGERVLWTALSYMQKEQENDHFLVYTGDEISKQEMLNKVKVRLSLFYTLTRGSALMRWMSRVDSGLNWMREGSISFN